ncbi:MAG TPA: MMPL family transporter, partial [Thermodesulfobacteriota bacterium]|nr:MMPL family transporter [Thermodesulfobacteriota bacterium]
LERNNLKGIFHLAGGPLGVQAAVREVIAEAQIWNLALALSMVFILCSLNFRSLTAGVILTVPLFISNLIAFALMAAYQIGLTVNTYPVSSVGIGLGVDYGIYFIGRLREEKKKTPDLSLAIVNTLKSNGKSIFLIATTLCIGLLIWLFSELRFQAEMGALLAILLFLNMLGALFLVPSFIAIFKPKFLTKIPCREEAKNV